MAPCLQITIKILKVLDYRTFCFTKFILTNLFVQNIVAEQPKFDMDGFMPVLKERMYSKSIFARQFHLGWLSALRAVPDSQLLKHLPGILDQLFIILSDDTNEIRTR